MAKLAVDEERAGGGRKEARLRRAPSLRVLQRALAKGVSMRAADPECAAHPRGSARPEIVSGAQENTR